MSRSLIAIFIALIAIGVQLAVFAQAFQAMVAGSSSGIALWLTSVCMAVITIAVVVWGKKV